nr:MAG TPA: hypothetical protein [Caudoviricetes sp.]
MVILFNWAVILKPNCRDTERLHVKIILLGLRIIKYT